MKLAPWLTSKAVKRITGELLDVKAVEDGFGVGSFLADGFEVAGGHVHGDGLELGQPFGPQRLEEGLNGRRALAPGEAEDSAFELTNLAFRAALSVQLVDWASLDYELAVIREPQILDVFQVRNNLLLTSGLSTGGPHVEDEE